EPVTESCSTCTIDLTAPATVAVHTDSIPNELVVDISNGESHTFPDVTAITSLTINGSSGDDTFTIQSVPDGFKVLAIDGGGGNNSLQGPDHDFLWQLTGVGAGVASLADVSQ